jgi:hypothetical protein
MKLTASNHRRGAENIARSAHAHRDDAHLPRFRGGDWFGDDFVDHFAATREWE